MNATAIKKTHHDSIFFKKIIIIHTFFHVQLNLDEDQMILNILNIVLFSKHVVVNNATIVNSS